MKEYILILGIVAMIAILSFIGNPLFQEIFAQSNQTRADIDAIKTKISNLENQTAKHDEIIIDQRKLIVQYESDFEGNKTKWRELKRLDNSTWIGIIELRDTQNLIDKLKDLITNSTAKLFSLLTERDQLILTYDLLLENQTQSIIDLRNENRPNLTGLTKLIGIELSQSCIKMLKYNITTDCPSYELLIQLDSSVTKVSGEFVTDKEGYFHRSPSPMQSSWNWYDYDKQIRIIVDPPIGMSERIKMIEIVPNFDTYTLINDMVQLPEFEIITVNITNTQGNQTKTREILMRNQTQDFGRILFHDRYVDNCSKAKINSEKWQEIIADTIHYLRTGCTQTSYNIKEVIYPNYSSIDVRTSPEYEKWLWFEAAKEQCKGLC